MQQVINAFNIEYGVFDMDIVRTSDNNLYLIELGAREGGNSQYLSYSSNYNPSLLASLVTFKKT